jgi:hypothetical protein
MQEKNFAGSFCLRRPKNTLGTGEGGDFLVCSEWLAKPGVDVVDQFLVRQGCPDSCHCICEPFIK